MEYRTTWNAKVTPLGRSYWEHSASPRRTSEVASIGLPNPWPTPVAQPANGTPEDFLRRKRESVARGSSMGITLSDLQMVAMLTPWPTPRNEDSESTGAATLTPWVSPTATDGSRGSLPARETDTGVPLSQQVAMTPWGTPSSRDWKDTPGMSQQGTNPDGSTRVRLDQLPRQVHGLITGSSTASTANRGVLDAAFVRWLMGFPATWDKASPGYQSWLEVQEAIALAD